MPSAVSSPVGEPVLTTHDLTLRRGRDDLVRGLNWTVEAGRITWIIGENGSGKSTLLAALAGRFRPAAGRIRYRAAAGGPVRYHPDMRAPAEVRVRDWRALVDALVPPGDPPSLAPDLPGDPPMGQLSTGQRKRMELESVLRRPAPCYLLDEPFSHLSGSARALLCQRLLLLVKRSAVIVATHVHPERLSLDHGPSPGPRPQDILHLEGAGRWRVGRPTDGGEA